MIQKASDAQRKLEIRDGEAREDRDRDLAEGDGERDDEAVEQHRPDRRQAVRAHALAEQLCRSSRAGAAPASNGRPVKLRDRSWVEATNAM